MSNPFRTCPTARCHGEHLYRRDDDNPETVRARLATFHARTGPLIEHYRRAGRLTTVCGSGAIETVSAASIEAARTLSRDGARLESR